MRRDGEGGGVRDTGAGGSEGDTAGDNTPPFQVTDLGSTNGTFVNGEKIAAHTHTPLLHGSVVSFGPPQVRHAWGG